MTDGSCNHFPASLGNVTFDPGVTVGIGTTSPGGALSFGAQVRTDLVYLYEGNSTNTFGLGIAPNTLQIYSSRVVTTAIALGTYDGTTFVEGMRLQAGQLGLGTPSPGYTLEVLGPDAVTSGLRVGTTGYTNLPPRLGVTTGVILNARGLNVVSDGASLGGGPSSGLGIAVNRADAALGVRNDGGPAAIFPFGTVGIATSSPAAPLDAPATACFAGTGNQSLWLSTADQTSGAWLRHDGTATVLSNNTGDIYVGSIGASKNLRFMGGGTVTQLILTPAGNVGIGNNPSPAYPLDVNGTVRATGLQLGGDMVLNGAIRDAGGSHQARVDAGGCYYSG